MANVDSFEVRCTNEKVMDEIIKLCDRYSYYEFEIVKDESGNIESVSGDIGNGNPLMTLNRELEELSNKHKDVEIMMVVTFEHDLDAIKHNLKIVNGETIELGREPNYLLSHVGGIDEKFQDKAYDKAINEVFRPLDTIYLNEEGHDMPEGELSYEFMMDGYKVIVYKIGLQLSINVLKPKVIEWQPVGGYENTNHLDEMPF